MRYEEKKKSKLKPIIIGLVLVLATGGIIYYIWGKDIPERDIKPSCDIAFDCRGSGRIQICHYYKDKAQTRLGTVDCPNPDRN